MFTAVNLVRKCNCLELAGLGRYMLQRGRDNFAGKDIVVKNLTINSQTDSVTTLCISMKFILAAKYLGFLGVRDSWVANGRGRVGES